MKNFTNPIIKCQSDNFTADPHVTRYKDYYYHCYYIDDGVYLARAKNLWELENAERVKVHPIPDDMGYIQWFAPELHRIDGAWYIYASPLVDGDDLHTMCVLERKEEDPFGKFESLGIMKGLENEWSIDGTVMEHEGERWFIWTKCTEMFMAKMVSPWEIEKPFISVMKPEFEFETKDNLVNEGPAVISHNGKLHLVFSANDSKRDEYCLGVMTYNGGGISDMKNWTKHPRAFFEKTEDIFGPGHCSFTTVTEDGKEVDYVVYHANLESGTGWSGRSVWAQPIAWDENDMPVFGKPER